MPRRKYVYVTEKQRQHASNPEDVELVRCPACGHIDTIDGFDVIGACGGNVFCTHCHCEFDPDTRLTHYPLVCPQCQKHESFPLQ